ncbi:copper homeostasis CutC domain-containing protein [Penicillium atrosanguineum]|uniref:Copper homeostasis protein cutC homolog n=1 Tax=Penicillium atrosanguineum TaxID=1132637 RepID=A0A9W9QAU9_9EURO|nr:uncharacterized protein N7443_000035 [Penicillium atrosanguineum]KAJ5128158.1 copper homeostasis CutC domain-containing protein [Penicillium atrosanguineum]KAJ5313151.1 hypothetical protein N7443_000035 [Penicillium atrosanguineum]KAJ5330256.1 copper homeostasis CutC domain-containing protein [Penicillium atrosanguineum]
MTPLLEIACFNQESAINAANGGADRIELCRDYASGGLSPAATTLMELKSQITVPIYVMIRPHSNGFCYDKESFEIMKTTLSNMRNLGADGFVFGILNPLSGDSSKSLSSWIDVARNKELVKLAKGKPCTFHRAFDCIPESHWDTALDDLKGCGFASVLTSGGPSSDRAIDCVDRLADLTQRLDPLQSHSQKSCNPLQIIVGGAVRANNVQVLRETSHAQAFHSSALISSDETVATSEVESLRAMLRGNPLQRKSTP